MRLCEITDEALEAMAEGYSCRGEFSEHHRLPTANNLKAHAAIFRELLDRRREDAARKRTVPAIKLAIAHVELLRDTARTNNQQAAVACLDMQIELLKEFDK